MSAANNNVTAVPCQTTVDFSTIYNQDIDLFYLKVRDISEKTKKQNEVKNAAFARVYAWLKNDTIINGDFVNGCHMIDLTRNCKPGIKEIFDSIENVDEASLYEVRLYVAQTLKTVLQKRYKIDQVSNDSLMIQFSWN